MEEVEICGVLDDDFLKDFDTAAPPAGDTSSKKKRRRRRKKKGGSTEEDDKEELEKVRRQENRASLRNKLRAQRLARSSGRIVSRYGDKGPTPDDLKNIDMSNIQDMLKKAGMDISSSDVRRALKKDPAAFQQAMAKMAAGMTK